MSVIRTYNFGGDNCKFNYHTITTQPSPPPFFFYPPLLTEYLIDYNLFLQTKVMEYSIIQTRNGVTETRSAIKYNMYTITPY